jgi:predicted negative regulator of RcsB-dependent stress response
MDPATGMKKSDETQTADTGQMPALFQTINELHQTREQFITQLAQIEAQHERLRSDHERDSERLRTDFERLRSDVDQLRNYFKLGAKIISPVLAVFVAVAGFFGFNLTYTNIVNTVEKNAQQKVDQDYRQFLDQYKADQINAYYPNLLEGMAFYTENQYEPAERSLMKSFRPGHYYETQLLMPLLSSIYQRDDWDAAKTVIDQLKSDDKLYATLPSSIYVLIGGIEIQGAPQHQDQNWLKHGFEDINRGAANTSSGDDATMRKIHTNLWIYDIQINDLAAAQREIDFIKANGVSHSSWDSMMKWKFFDGFFNDHPELKAQLRAMWEQLPSSQ